MLSHLKLLDGRYNLCICAAERETPELSIFNCASPLVIFDLIWLASIHTENTLPTLYFQVLQTYCSFANHAIFSGLL